jgi:hypothetical protein
MKRDYYIRAIEADWPKVLEFAELLGVGRMTEFGFWGECWVYIGPLNEPTGEFTQVDGVLVEQRRVITDQQGRVYLHANVLQTEIDLRARAEQLAAQDPEMAVALSQEARYFVTDETGEPVAPSTPAVVLF